MEWNLKAASSWDLVDVDKATTLPNMETMEEEPSRFGVYRMKGEFSVDLKLGHVGNSGTEKVVAKSNDAGASGGVVSKMASSPSGSSKRARAINNSALAVSCLVDGCNSDLSNCRDYHRRHKVCELHSKTPEVTIGGWKQRFCQQCSRFHSLEQFDERKRSCRKRLDGHNRRRRKPQPETLTRSGSFLSNYQGTQLLPFSGSHVYPSTAVANPSWSGGLVTSSADARLHNHNHNHNQHQQQDLFLGSSQTSYKPGKQVAFLHSSNHPSTAALNNQQTPHFAAAPVCQTVIRSSPASESCGVVRSKMLCESRTSSVHDSPCALSLLSSSSTSARNGLNQMMQQQQQPSTMSLMQPLGLSLESVDPVLVPNGSEHCSSLYSLGSDGSQCSEAPQLFPFQWE